MDRANPQTFSRVYLDHNATAPLHGDVLSGVPNWLQDWGNPGSIHASGRVPKALLRQARHDLGRLVGASPLELIFTSGGSESNNLAIKGVMTRAKALGRNELIVSRVEHPSVLKAARALVGEGIRVHEVPVHRDGFMDLEFFESHLNERTGLVSIMFANNETGSVFPVKRLAEMSHRVGALFHTDAVQALGKTTVQLEEWGVDLASFAAHKFYALKGVGALYVRKGVEVEPLIHGGGQERGRRAGTENVLGIAAWGAVARAAEDLEVKIVRMRRLRDLLEALVSEEISDVSITGAKAPRISNTSSLVIEGVDGETLLMNLDLRGFSVSTGAACSSGSPEPSPVLLAMGLERREAQSSLRVSLGWETSEAEIIAFARALSEVVKRLRSFRHGEAALYG